MSSEYGDQFKRVSEEIEAQGGRYGFYEERTGNSVDGRVGKLNDGAQAIYERTRHPHDRTENDSTRVIITAAGAGGVADNGTVKYDRKFGSASLARIVRLGLRREQR